MDVDALPSQYAGEELGELGLVTRHQPVASLQERHADPETIHGLRHLDSDGAAAHDYDTARRVLELEEVLARQEARLLEPRHRRHRWAAARAEENTARLEHPLAHDDGVWPCEAGRAEDELDSHRLVAGGVVVCRGDLLLNRTDPAPDCGEVDLGLDGRQSVAVGGSHVLRDLCRGEQRLRGDAARPEAVAPDAAPFDYGHAHSERCRELGGDDAARAHPDDDEVVPHHVFVSSALANEMVNARHQMTTVL